MNIRPATSLLFALAISMAGANNYESGMRALREGRPAEALPLLEAARRRAPRDVETLFGLASCYLALGRSAEAQSTLDELAKSQPKDPAVLLAGASVYSA